MKDFDERVHIGEMTRRTGREGVPGDRAIPEETNLSNEDWWKKYKPEIYSLGAIITDKVIKSAIQNKEKFPPYGIRFERGFEPANLDFLSTRPATKDNLRNGIRFTIDLELTKELERLEKPTSETDQKMKSIYDRYKDLIKQFYKRGLFPGNFAGIQPSDVDGYGRNLMFIQRGVNQAAQTISEFMDVVPEVFFQENPRRNYDPEQFAQMFKNSYPTIAFLASEHLVKFLATVNHLKKPGRSHTVVEFSADKFVLETNGGQTSVVIAEKHKHPSETEIQNLIDKSKLPDYANGPTIGCLAFISVSGQNVGKTLFDWIANDVALDYYKSKEKLGKSKI